MTHSLLCSRQVLGTDSAFIRLQFAR